MKIISVAPGPGFSRDFLDDNEEIDYFGEAVMRWQEPPSSG